MNKLLIQRLIQYFDFDLVQAQVKKTNKQNKIGA